VLRLGSTHLARALQRSHRKAYVRFRNIIHVFDLGSVVRRASGLPRRDRPTHHRLSDFTLDWKIARNTSRLLAAIPGDHARADREFSRKNRDQPALSINWFRQNIPLDRPVRRGGQYLATATNALDLTVEFRVLAIDWTVRIHQVFLRGHLIGVRLAVVDRCEVSTSASNAIIVINFPMMGLRVRAPHDHGNGKLDHKVRQTSRFVQTLQHRAHGDASRLFLPAANPAAKPNPRQ
jgi:hypothetical protein